MPSVGIAPTYQVLQTCANLSQLTWRISPSRPTMGLFSLLSAALPINDGRTVAIGVAGG